MNLRESMLRKQRHQKNAIFVIIGIFLDKGFKFEPYLCNGCHDLMQKVTSFNDVAIVSVKGSFCRIHFWYMSKDYAITIMKNSDLKGKKWIAIKNYFNFMKNE